MGSDFLPGKKTGLLPLSERRGPYILRRTCRLMKTTLLPAAITITSSSMYETLLRLRESIESICVVGT